MNARNNQKKSRSRLVIISFIFVVIAVVVFISWPFKEVIAISLVLAYILSYPTTILEKRIHTRRGAALIVMLSIFGVFMLILLSIVYTLYNEFLKLLTSSESIDSLFRESLQRFVATISTKVSQSITLISIQEKLPNIISSILDKILSVGTNTALNIITNVPLYFVELIIITLLVYWLLVGGNKITNDFKFLVPLEYQNPFNTFLRHVHSIYYTLYVVHIAASVLSGIMAAIGFTLLGVPYSLTFAILIAIFGLIPVIGRALIYVPITIYFFIIGDPVRAVVFFMFSWLVLDQFTGLYVEPQLARHTAAAVPQILTLLSFTVPILAIGPIGIIVGPAVYGLALAIYRTHRDLQMQRTQFAEI